MFFHAHSLRLLYSMPIQNQFAKPPLRGFSFAPNINKKAPPCLQQDGAL